MVICYLARKPIFTHGSAVPAATADEQIKFRVMSFWSAGTLYSHEKFGVLRNSLYTIAAAGTASQSQWCSLWRAVSLSLSSWWWSSS